MFVQINQNDQLKFTQKTIVIMECTRCEIDFKNCFELLHRPARHSIPFPCRNVFVDEWQTLFVSSSTIVVRPEPKRFCVASIAVRFAIERATRAPIVVATLNCYITIDRN
jgi:hypothetical protein